VERKTKTPIELNGVEPCQNRMGVRCVFKIDVTFDGLNAEDLISDLEIDIECPKCKEQFNVRFKQIKQQEIVHCPHCNVNIQLETTES